MANAVGTVSPTTATAASRTRSRLPDNRPLAGAAPGGRASGVTSSATGAVAASVAVAVSDSGSGSGSDTDAAAGETASSDAAVSDTVSTAAVTGSTGPAVSAPLNAPRR